MPTACLVKPPTARIDFLGFTWDSPIGASVFNLRPLASPVEPRRAQGWAHGRPWSTRTVFESGHWKAGGPGLLILCSSASDRAQASCVDDGRPMNMGFVNAGSAHTILPFRNSSEKAATP